MKNKEQIIARISGERTRLLAKKYSKEDQFSQDDAIRLASLTDELRELCPRVTEEDWKVIENMKKELDTMNVDLLDGDGSGEE